MLAPLVNAHTVLTSQFSAVPSPSPTPSPTPTNPFDLPSTNFSTVPCTKDSISVCGLVFRFTGHKELGQVLEVVLGTPLRVLLIILIGVLIRRTLHRLIHRLAERIATGPTVSIPDSIRRRRSSFGIGRSRERRPGPTSPAAVTGASPLLTTRRQARARTLASVLRSVTTALIGVVVFLMVLQELDFSVGPLLASASVVGVALGLGAQSLVRDIVAGMFMIIEDQYGVGDVVDVGAASGAVEAVGLRVTRLRDVNGTVWYVRNGEIMRVGNQSQGWSRTVLDVNIGYAEDLDQIELVLLDTARKLRSDPKFSPLILDEPEVWGVEALTPDGVVMRLVVKTQPQQQWTVARELRRRIKTRFDLDGIETRPMSRTVIVNGDDEPEAHHADAADSLEQ